MIVRLREMGEGEEVIHPEGEVRAGGVIEPGRLVLD